MHSNAIVLKKHLPNPIGLHESQSIYRDLLKKLNTNPAFHKAHLSIDQVRPDLREENGFREFPCGTRELKIACHLHINPGVNVIADGARRAFVDCGLQG